MLGKLQPRHFPFVFGPDQDQPLDAEVVARKFTDLAATIAKEAGQPCLAPEELAEGFLRIAVENMANAIKKISVQRGYDVTRYTLNCFDRAGGQHATAIADTLGIETVFIHPFAGVLSAYGMGLADIRSLRERQFEREVSEIATAEAALAELAAEAEAEVRAQGVAASAITTIRRAHLRYRGSHQPLEVEFGSEAEMRERFDTAHRARYGFSAGERELVIEVLAVEAIGGAGEIQEKLHPLTEAAATALDRVSMIVDGQRREIPLYDRDRMRAGQAVEGPAIIRERTGTNIVDPGWLAEINGWGHLIMRRTMPRSRVEAIGTHADPIMLEV